ncbi:MAG: c-type cytochrome [Campylobacterota bacterium]|nr:c-type cytochrome [Campylobacterota bacterium]
MKKLVLVIVIMGTTMMASEGIVLYKKKCVMCHGVNGEKNAFGKSDIIADWDAAKIEEALNGYKAGRRNVHGMGSDHKAHLSAYSAEDIKAVAAYVASFK